MRPIFYQRDSALAFYLMVCCMPAMAQDEGEEDWVVPQPTVSIATGTQQSLIKAPATASVITSDDIQSMGAVDLDQVLESIAGLHVSVGSLAYNSMYLFRGISSQYNPQVLMLVNGLPITNVYLGNRSMAWGGMPLENIARIEVIRGPGSALYGADAVSGVVNIITKKPSEIHGLEYGVRAGNLNTQDAWLQYGGKLTDSVEAGFYLRKGHTDGQQGVVKEDLQKQLDGLFGTQASFAPSTVNTGRNALDAGMELSFNQLWHTHLRYQHRELGTGAGVADSLDPAGRLPESRVYWDLSYQNPTWSDKWGIAGAVGYYDIKEYVGSPAFMLFPRGAFNGAFPDGVIGNPGHFERHATGDLTATYSGFEKHKMKIGVGFRKEDLYEAQEFKNFSIQVIPNVGPAFIPLGSVVNATGNPALVYMQPHERDVKYGLIQDEWRLANDLGLTLGVRHDQYSDFGGTTNPRVALVWDAAYNLTIKAMHGRAFRAPSFNEQYNSNNPVSTGNPNLRPETIAMNELSVVWEPNAKTQTNLTFFQYDMKDSIEFMPNVDPATGSTAQNTAGQKGRGFELEGKWQPNAAWKFTGSFSVQHSHDKTTGQDAGLAPHRKLFVRSDWHFMPQWQLGAVVNRIEDRARQPGDARPKVPDYTTMDLTLSREKIMGGWGIRATMFNLFNRQAFEPSFASSTGASNIPFDLPLPGRTFYIQFQHKI